MAPPVNRNLEARVQRLENAAGPVRVKPLIVLHVVEDEHRALRGFQVTAGNTRLEVMRLPRESDAELKARARAAVDGIVGRQIVVSLVELRGP